MAETRKRQKRPIQPVPRLALTREEAAISVGMSIDTFERKVQPYIKLVPCGALLLVPTSEMERWVRDNARHINSFAQAEAARNRVAA